MRFSADRIISNSVLITAVLFTCAVGSLRAQYSTLYSFSATGDGFTPGTTLTEVAPNVFVGTATSTIFEINSTGSFRTLATFDPNTVGGATAGQLYPASNGFLYGSNDSGAAGETNGSIFVTDLSGNVRVLNSNTYGASPLTQASDGNLYGVSASSA